MQETQLIYLALKRSLSGEKLVETKGQTDAAFLIIQYLLMTAVLNYRKQANFSY